MSRPTAFRTMNSVYSRRTPVRARWLNDQCRFPRYAQVAAMIVDSALDVSGPQPNAAWNTL